MSFRKSVALSISLVIAFTSAMAQSRVCLPDYRYGPQTYSFLRPTLVNPTIASAPFLLPFQEIYETYGRQERLQVRTNLQEWHERFCEVPDINDMGRLIYQASIRDLQALESSCWRPSSASSPVRGADDPRQSPWEAQRVCWLRGLPRWIL